MITNTQSHSTMSISNITISLKSNYFLSQNQYFGIKTIRVVSLLFSLLSISVLVNKS